MPLIGCNTANTLCLHKKFTDSATFVTIEAKVSGPDGWAAFGIGKEMIGSPLYVFWKNSAGECVVSRRDSSNYETPGYSNNQVQQITTLDPTVQFKVSDANLKCTMDRPYAMRPAISQDLIWAVGAGVKDGKNPESGFGKHRPEDSGTIQVSDVKDPEPKSDASDILESLSKLFW